MSKENDPILESLQGMTIDELIASTKLELQEDVQPEPEIQLEPLIGPAYTDLSVEEAEEVPEEEADEEDEEEDNRRIPAILRVMLYVCCVLATSVLLAVGAWKCLDEVCALTAADRPVTITVEEGDTISTITKKLRENHLIEYEWLFSLYCMMSNAEAKIDPGTYQLNELFDYHALVNGMIETSENRATVRVTIPEGYEAEDIFAILEENGVCTVAELKEAAANYAFDYAFLEGLEYGSEKRLEGYLFPDTYEFYVGDKAPNVLAKFLRNFDRKITDEMYADLEELNQRMRTKLTAAGYSEAEIQEKLLTFHDVIIVASLVEKETTRTAESASISSVIYNRLCSRLYPCLNIDATVQYVLPERKEVLTLADKSVISPYNTYTNAGLPVGPISNPGINSIRAALYPANNEYYFYALYPGGNNHFSETAAEHQEFLDEISGKTLQEQEQQRLQELEEARQEMAQAAAVQEDRAIEIALEEARREKYLQEGDDFSGNTNAVLLLPEEKPLHWDENWTIMNENGEPLYAGQAIWSVCIANAAAADAYLYIYVDIQTGAVVGAARTEG